MESEAESSETAGSVKIAPVQGQASKYTEGENDVAEADMNANIGSTENQSAESFAGVDLSRSAQSGSPATDPDLYPIENHEVKENVESDVQEGECVASTSEIHEESCVQETSEVEGTRQQGIPQESPPETTIEDSQDESTAEKTIAADEMVLHDEEANYVGNTEDQGDDTPTVVVTTTGEGGQYEIHMVGSEFRELTEGLPEGTQLMTEDGQLIHAVQEDEHGNMVVLADPLSEIQTVDEPAGNTEVGETHEMVEDDEVAEEAAHDMRRDVVSEAASEAQVAYVQEEMLEQQPEVVMLGEDVGYIVTEGESEEIIVGEAPTLEVCAETEIGTSGHADMAGVYTDEAILDNYMPEEGQVVVERIGYQVPVLAQNTDQDVHHEEFIEDDDDEIGFHEDVVISESNHTIPNYDEAHEIRMLTEAANNSLRSIEEQSPPKKRRPRKRTSGEQSTAARKRRRPTQLYFNEHGQPMPGRAQQLLSGLENLNLPIATAGTAPMSPPPPPEPEPAPQPEPAPPPLGAHLPQAAAAYARVRAPPPPHPSRLEQPFLPPHPNLRLKNPPRGIPELAIPQLMSPQLMSPRHRSPSLSSPSAVPPGLISPLMVSPRMVSPGQQTPTSAQQLSPRTVSATQKKHPQLSAMLSLTSPGAQGLSPNVSPPAGMAVTSPGGSQMVRMPRNVTPVAFPLPPPGAKVEGHPPGAARPAVPNSAASLEMARRPPGPQFAAQSARPSPPVSAPLPTSPVKVVSTTQQVLRGPPPLLQAVPNRPLQFPNLQEYRMALQTAQQHLQNNPRFQQIIANLPPLQSVPQAVNPMVAHPSRAPGAGAVPNITPQQPAPGLPVTAQLATASTLVDVKQLINEGPAPSISEAAATRDNVNAVQSATDQSGDEVNQEGKPKVSELIKSQLLAAAWGSGQPNPPVPDKPPEKPPIIEKPTIAATISRVEEHLRKVAAEGPRPKAAATTEKTPQLPRYPAPAAVPLIPTLPTSAGFVRVPVPGAAAIGATLPPISTLQTKLPPGLVPSTLALPTSAPTPLQMQSTSVALSTSTTRPLTAVQATGTVLESPLADDKDSRIALPGQITVPRGALRSPVLSTGLGKDPMLAGSSLNLPKSHQTVASQPTSSQAIKSPTSSFAAGRLPAAFPLAFAPGLPPLMMQPSLGFRPGLTPQSSAAGSKGSPAAPGASVAHASTTTTGQQKTLQTPPANQVNPLDLIMEVMKKEMNVNPQALIQGQTSPNDAIRLATSLAPGSADAKTDAMAVPRFPTPGPTMEMLIQIMQREMAAAQIQTQVAAMHAAQAQAEAQKITGSTGVRAPPARTAQAQALPTPAPQAPQPQPPPAQAAAPPPPVRSTLPPVSTVMPVNHVQPMEQRPPVVNHIATTPNHVTTPAPLVQSAPPQPPANAQSAPSVSVPQRFLTPKSEKDTLADKYMKEWKPTGRFQCKFCYYSCVTQNFLFRHWVMNHCCMKPYLCAYCGLKSPTRDGITRHQTSKHKGHPRKVVIDATQETTLVSNFKTLFNLDVKEIHPEDIRRDNLDGLVFPEPYDPRTEKRSPGGTSNGETDFHPSATQLNYLTSKSPGISPDKQRLTFHPPPAPPPPPNDHVAQIGNEAQFEQLPPHLREHFLATAAPVIEENGTKSVDHPKRHHKKSVVDSVGSSLEKPSVSEPLSKEQLHAMALAMAQQQQRSGPNNETQKLPSISEMRRDATGSPMLGPNTANNTLPSIRDLIQMPRGQILAAMTGLTQAPNTSFAQQGQISSPPVFSQSMDVPMQQQTSVSGVGPKSNQTPQGGFASAHDEWPHLPAGVVVPRPPHPAHTSKPPGAATSETESEAHQAAAQLVSMANSRNPVPTRHMTPPLADHNQQVASMVINVAVGAEQQKAALSIEHEVAAQLEDFARRKAGQSSKSPPVSVSQAQSALPGPNPVLLNSEQQKQLSIDEQVALQLEEFRRRKAVIEAREALKPKKSPRAKSKRPSPGMSHPDQRHGGANSVDQVVAQLHHMAQKRAHDQQLQQLKTAAAAAPVQRIMSAPAPQPELVAAQQVLMSHASLDEQRLLELDLASEKGTDMILAAIRARSEQVLSEQKKQQQQHDHHPEQEVSKEEAPEVRASALDLFERAVVESYENNEAVGPSDTFNGSQGESSSNVEPTVSGADQSLSGKQPVLVSAQMESMQVAEAPDPVQAEMPVPDQGKTDEEQGVDLTKTSNSEQNLASTVLDYTHRPTTVDYSEETTPSECVGVDSQVHHSVRSNGEGEQMDTQNAGHVVDAARQKQPASSDDQAPLEEAVATESAVDAPLDEASEQDGEKPATRDTSATDVVQSESADGSRSPVEGAAPSSPAQPTSERTDSAGTSETTEPTALSAQ